ncbi:protein kinase [Gemmatimonadota bacterium]
MICPACQSENPNSNWYCDRCGQSLREADAAVRQHDVASDETPAAPGKTIPDDSSPALLFADRYRDLTRIGDGAMAIVYRAHDEVLGQIVALKVLHPDLAGNQNFIERFRREIALARTITHPNVYRIYDIGENVGNYFISMEYIDGWELKSLIPGKKFKLAKGLNIIQQVAQGLNQAHCQGIIHRDLKPQNIMIEKKTNRCVVMDFGIAMEGNLSALTQTGSFLGTPDYISPEQAKGDAIDSRSDIYSLGVIMYEMFTGRLPFIADNPLAVAVNHINKAPIPPRELNRKIPQELENIILRAMQKDPNLRFSDSDELIESIQSLTASGSKRKTKVTTAKSKKTVDTDLEDKGNPYLNRKMIRDMRYFFGRKKEIATIYSRIGAARPQSVSIVGERRIGKSSLLYYLNQEENRRNYLKKPENYIFVIMDFQEKRRVSLEDFFISLFEAMKKHGKNQISSFPQPGYNGFKKVCEELDNQNMRLILLFDEFESITKNKNFDPEFFSFLRSVANNYNVAYVTSSVKNLQELCYNREISDSPFFNIFSNIILSVFSEKEARQFVCEPSRKSGHPLEDHFETVTELAGYFPFYMAIACSILYEFDFGNANKQKTVVENIEELFLDEAGMHFQFILNSLSQDEIRICRKIIEKKPLQDIDKYVVKNIAKRGYLIAGENPDEAKLFSKTFADILLEQSIKKIKT